MLLYFGGLLALIVLAAGWARHGWVARRRLYAHALRLLQEKAWQDSEAAAIELRRRSWSAAGRRRAADLEGRARRLAGDLALQGGLYEEALEHYRAAGGLTPEGDADGRDRVRRAMLGQLRMRFAGGEAAGSLQPFVDRMTQLCGPSAEAWFWQGLSQLGAGNLAAAQETLRRAEDASPGTAVDPPFYLAVLALREGRLDEALGHLGEAGARVPDCPLVRWQTGLARAAQGDDAGAVAALVQAVGSAGLPRWANRPAEFWKEAWPSSYVARLASEQRYCCPVLGGEVTGMIRQARIALARAEERCGNLAAAAEQYRKIVEEGPPSLPVLRGLGLALARLGRWEEASRPLCAVYEQEGPVDQWTVAYLALCAARATTAPSAAGRENVTWALGQLGRFDGRGEAEWADVCNAVLARARAEGVAVPAEEQVRWCDLLASAEATSADAAAAYACLARCAPERLRSEHAWLYGQAAQRHGVVADAELDLFARIFGDRQAARGFYEERGWDLEEVEYAYLSRWADRRPGDFPPGVTAPAAEAILQARCEKLEAGRRPEEALAAADVWHRLAPRSVTAHQRLARLCYRLGDPDRAVELLAVCGRLDPTDPGPLVRSAAIRARQGHDVASAELMDQALARATGPEGAGLALLAARLALAGGAAQWTDAALVRARSLYIECLRRAPGDGEALRELAAVRCLLGDHEGLAGQAAAMSGAQPTVAGFAYFAAACHLEAGNGPRAVEMAEGVSPDRAGDAAYLMGRAFAEAGGRAQAAAHFQHCVRLAPAGPSADYARATLGRWLIEAGDDERAVALWAAMSPAKRSAWGFDRPLREAVYRMGVRMLLAGRLPEAVRALREARRLGLDCTAVLRAAWTRAGREALAGSPDDRAGAVALLEEMRLEDPNDGGLACLLSQIYERQGDGRSARQVLTSLREPDSKVLVRLGCLWLLAKALDRAEEAFGRAWELDPTCEAAGHNLVMTRLSRGRLEEAAAALAGLVEVAAENNRTPLRMLGVLLAGVRAGSGVAPPADSPLRDISLEEEGRLVETVRRLGNREAEAALLAALVAARPESRTAREAYLEAELFRGKALFDAGRWLDASRLLARVAAGEAREGSERELRDRGVPSNREGANGRKRTALGETSRALVAAAWNLAGCAACLAQDFRGGEGAFAEAMRWGAGEAWIYQNRALACEWDRRFDAAQKHWKHYLGALRAGVPRPVGFPEYEDQLAYECLVRLAEGCGERERSSEAAGYLAQARQVRARDVEALQRLVDAYRGLDRPDEARNTLNQLRRLRPGDARWDLTELGLMEVRDLDGVQRLLVECDRILRAHPGDTQLAGQAAEASGHAIEFLARCDQELARQVARAGKRMQRLSENRADGARLREHLGGLRYQFQKLKWTATRVLPLVHWERHREVVRRVVRHAEGQIDRCREMVARW